MRVYIATSLDGFIAGEGHDLSWLPDPAPDDNADDGALFYDEFMLSIGALLMGRRTYDVVRSFDVEWPYGDRPVLVASHRPLETETPSTVRRVEGSIQDLIGEAKGSADGKDVYIDGGVLIRQACAAGLVDDLTISLAPIALGSGYSLFAGLEDSFAMRVVGAYRFPGGMVQLRLSPAPSDSVEGAT